MRKRMRVVWAAGGTLLLSVIASSNSELLAMHENTAKWAVPTGDYANIRYSSPIPIDSGNDGHVKAAWTHSNSMPYVREGVPMSVDEMVYVHAHMPLPNMVHTSWPYSAGKLLGKHGPTQHSSTVPVLSEETINRRMAYRDGRLLLRQAGAAVASLEPAAETVVVLRAVNDNSTVGPIFTSAPKATEMKEQQDAMKTLHGFLSRPTVAVFKELETLFRNAIEKLGNETLTKWEYQRDDSLFFDAIKVYFPHLLPDGFPRRSMYLSCFSDLYFFYRDMSCTSCVLDYYDCRSNGFGGALPESYVTLLGALRELNR